MIRKQIRLRLITLLIAVTGAIVFAQPAEHRDARFVSYIADPNKQDVRLYYKNDQQQSLKSIRNLKLFLERKNKDLVFAMNAGMYKPDNSPLGLFIENNIIITPLNTANGSGNFYLKPNGVFYITEDNIPLICTTPEFKNKGRVKYATQSGPMLLIDGNIHPEFKQGSVNTNIRNGVGVLPDNKILFAMSKTEINLYDFALYFKEMGCNNALYLDGFVSRAYLPEQNWVQTDGDFGVMIGVTNTVN